jgi:hypothetical protein
LKRREAPFAESSREMVDAFSPPPIVASECYSGEFLWRIFSMFFIGEK